MEAQVRRRHDLILSGDVFSLWGWVFSKSRRGSSRHASQAHWKPCNIVLHVSAGWDKGQVPDNMLRFILLVNVTSSAFPSHNTVITIKACSHS